MPTPAAIPPQKIDSGNNAIRRVSPNGIISTVAGNVSSSPGNSGDGGLGAHDAALSWLAIVYSRSLAAIRALLNGPQAVAFNDSSSCAFWIADTNNHAASFSRSLRSTL